MNDKITTALDDLDDALDELGISGAAYNRPPESQFTWEVSSCGRFVRVWDGETWYAEAEDFAVEVEVFAEAIRERGCAAFGLHSLDDMGHDAYDVHQAFCDATSGECDADDVDEECEAAFAITDRMEQGKHSTAVFLEEADDLDGLRERLLLLRAAAEETPYKLEEVCDLTSLPTFGGREPADTIEVWSWDAARLMIGHEFELEPRTADMEND
jgi:hypothetical protein